MMDTYEKKYKGALARCKWLLSNGMISKIAATDMFRELMDNDENIRKEIINIFHSLADGKIPVDINYADIFTWLEKQGKKNSVTTEEEEKVREQVVYAINKLNVPESEKNKLLAWLEKQGEKPKPSIRERYKRIANSEWFKKTHEGMSVSDDDKWELVEKKPSWSEEDETKLKSACALIKNTSLNGNEGIVDSTIDWLKSLKERIGG